MIHVLNYLKLLSPDILNIIIRRRLAYTEHTTKKHVDVNNLYFFIDILLHVLDTKYCEQRQTKIHKYAFTSLINLFALRLKNTVLHLYAQKWRL